MEHSGKKAGSLKFLVYVFIYPSPILSSMFSTEVGLLCAWCPLVLSPLWDDISSLWIRHKEDCSPTPEHRDAGNQHCFNSVSWEFALSFTFSPVSSVPRAIRLWGSTREVGPFRIFSMLLQPFQGSSLFSTHLPVCQFLKCYFSPFQFNLSCRFMSMNKTPVQRRWRGVILLALTC